jgi:glycosyltransferase involved in cell wall biosynthesis
MLARRRHLRTRGRILQFHRAGVPLAFIGRSGPSIQVVHLNVADIYGSTGESRWRLLPGLYHRVEDITIGKMSRIFVVNKAGVRFYQARHPELKDRIQFMPTWFDDTIFRPVAVAERSLARQEVFSEIDAAPSDDQLVVFVGRLEKQKDPILLVDSLVAAVEMGLNVRLLIVGDGNLRTATELHAAASPAADRIHFLGWRPRSVIARLLGACDAMLLTSRFEGMPIAVLEALACGLPVVSTSVGEVPRLVQQGESGWLAEDRTPAAIAAALGHVLVGSTRHLTVGAIHAAAPFAATIALAPFYTAHRELVKARP